MNWRWIMSLVLALALHLAWLGRTGSQAVSETPAPGVPDLIVAEAEPFSPPPATAPPQPDPQEMPEPEPLEVERFRPNQEPEEAETEVRQEGDSAEAAVEDAPAETTDAEPEPEPESQVSPEPMATSDASPDPLPDSTEDIEPEQETPPLAQAPRPPKLTKDEIRTGVTRYRQKLMGDFDKQYTRVPELHTAVQDPALIPQIDRHFGITTLAYSFVDHKPGPPFILFEETHYQKLDTFDFSNFSNRIKDRMLYHQYRDRLQTARQQHGIKALMKMIGLVPSQTDRYFSAKQLRAVQLAGLPLERVAATQAHYEPHGADGFTLIVDAVVTKDGRVLPVQDEELKFSVPQDSKEIQS
jgi:hypothetical protein